MREWQDTIGVRRGCVFFVWCVMSKWVANRGISGQIKFFKCCLCFVLDGMYFTDNLMPQRVLDCPKIA